MIYNCKLGGGLLNGGTVPPFSTHLRGTLPPLSTHLGGNIHCFSFSKIPVRSTNPRSIPAAQGNLSSIRVALVNPRFLLHLWIGPIFTYGQRIEVKFSWLKWIEVRFISATGIKFFLRKDSLQSWGSTKEALHLRESSLLLILNCLNISLTSFNHKILLFHADL